MMGKDSGRLEEKLKLRRKLQPSGQHGFHKAHILIWPCLSMPACQSHHHAKLSTQTKPFLEHHLSLIVLGCLVGTGSLKRASSPEAPMEWS